MFMPRTLQGYIASSQIFGDYGNPWDTAVGVNWFPMGNRLLRLNGEILYTQDSAVGNSSAPYLVGGDGAALNTNVEMKF
jgi:beta-galactosidase/beta-glucuronidase